MHPIKRARQSEAATRARKEQERSKIAEYLALNDDVIARKKNKDWSEEAFNMTQRLLQVNPEFYTIWNYRRNIMLNGIFPRSSPEQINELLTNELELISVALKPNPKVYWLWNHRRWCLQNIPEGPIVDGQPSVQWRSAKWDDELAQVEKMLNRDPRNFHAWNYRRYVLASMPMRRPERDELAYTAQKVNASLSNFSAWHQRSKVHSLLWKSGELDPMKSRNEELELVHRAIYTDPEDQSAWIYHRWLLGSDDDEKQLEQEISIIEELLSEQPDSRWCMDTLVHCKKLLLQHQSHYGDGELRENCLMLLGQLQKIDPYRRRRYEELAGEIEGHDSD